MLEPQVVRVLSADVEAVALDLAQMLRAGELQAEDPFTSRLIDRIRVRIDKRTIGGVRWSAIETVSQGMDSQERATGADLLAVLKIDVSPTHLTKGFLAQAKVLRSNTDLEDLKRQCEDMLQWTPSAYAWFYTESGVWTAPAIAIAATTPPRVPALISLGEFFVRHLDCWIGDRDIAAATRTELEEMRQEYRARRALMLRGTPEDLAR